MPDTLSDPSLNFTPPARTGIQKKIVNLTKNVQIGFSRKIRK
jgi:hypothetical protein